jgi:uncharacterized membrane protein YphA (DoxX/SURF4 family)
VTPALDPAVATTLRIGLALLFLGASLHKLRDGVGFRAALEGYGFLPQGWLAPVASLLAAAELAIAAGLLVPAGTRTAALAAAALLALYAGAMFAALAAGRRGIDCGCAGPLGSRPLGPSLVVRNALLVAVALVAALPVAPRSLAWIDGVTVAGAIAAGACLVAATQLSIEQAARGRALRPRREA